MKKQLIAVGLLIALVYLCAFSGCTDNNPAPDVELKKVEQVGEIPASFKSIIENNRFNGVTAFDERLLKTEILLTNEESRTVTYQILMMDLYGKTLASYTCSSDDAYTVSTLTATEDGGFLFVLGFSDYAYDQHTWASDKGFASRVIKCDKNGNLQFDVPFDSISGFALEYCIEKNGHFYFFGTAETPETKTRGVHSPTDIYMAILDKNGNLLNTQCIAGSDYDGLQAAEMSGDGFVLSIHAQSDDGDFADSGSNGHLTDWVFTVNENLEITEKKKTSGREFLDYRIGEKDGVSVYKSAPLLKDFDAGSVSSFIDYGDSYLVVSENNTGIYENTPLAISSLWFYTETVYSLYDYSGKLIFRASVDSSPDYDARVESFISQNDSVT